MDYSSSLSISPFLNLSKLLLQLKWQIGADVRDKLELKRSEWNRLVQAKDIPYDCFKRTLDNLGINIGTLTNGPIDSRAVEKFLQGETDYIPEQYLRGAFSSRRIGRIILNIIEDYYGKTVKDELLVSLQIGPDFFNPKNDYLTVSTLLYSRLYFLLKRNFRLTDKDLFWIGQKTSLYNQDSPMAKRFETQTLQQAYDYYLEEVSKHVEKSYSYEMGKLDSNVIIFRKKPSMEMQDSLRTKIYGNNETCIYSLGFTTTVGHFSSGLYPKAKKTKCLYAGDSYTEFVIDLKDASRPSFFAPKQYCLQ